VARPEARWLPPLKINDLRSTAVSFTTLPKLDVAGSSPVARSRKSRHPNW
jgi:hypothetical protein